MHIQFCFSRYQKRFWKTYNGPKTGITSDHNDPDKEPNCKDSFAAKLSGGLSLTRTKQPCRGDIFFSLGNVRKLLDVVISHPDAAALKKEILYYNNFAIPAG